MSRKRDYSSVQRLGRRAVLRSTGGAALALPFLETLAPVARAQQAGPKRFILMMTHQGWGTSRTTRGENVATGTETNFQLGQVLAPLGRHKQYVMPVWGVDNKIWTHFHKSGWPPDGHFPNYPTALTANIGPQSDDGNGNIASQTQNGGSSYGPSIDQAIGQKLAAQGQRSNLNFGIGQDGQGNGHHTFYEAAQKRASFIGSPERAYQTFLAGQTASGGSGDGGSGGGEAEPPPMDERDLSLVRRHRVVDAVLSASRSLQNRLSASDRQRLERHLDSVRDIERRLPAVPDPVDPTAPTPPPAPTHELACDPQSPGSFPNYGFNNPSAQQDDLIALQFDIGVRSLACGVAPVASFWFNTLNQALNGIASGIDSRDWHDGHVHEYRATPGFIWYAEQYAKLLDRLAAEPDGTGTMLDSTMLLWTSNYGDGGWHRGHKILTVLAGATTHPSGMGRYLRLDDGDINSESTYGTNQLYVSIMNALGIPDQTFGYHKLVASGGIPGIA